MPDLQLGEADGDEGAVTELKDHAWFPSNCSET